VPELLRAASTQVEPIRVEESEPARDAGTPSVPKALAPVRPAPRSAPTARAWRPSGEATERYEAPAPPPMPALPVEPAEIPLPREPEPSGTPPNPFLDETPAPQLDEETTYRAGKPREDEF
jgi:hypothetical protein